MSTGPPLALQVQFNTIVAPCVPIYSSNDPQRRIPWDVRTRAHLTFIADAIAAAGRRAGPVFKDLSHHGPDNYHWSVALHALDLEEDYPAEVALEGSVLEDCYGTAVVSPLYHVRTSHVHWRKSLTAALRGVTARCNWKANTSSELRVLIGRPMRNPEASELTLSEMQRIAMLVCRFEDVLDTLCGAYRNPESTQYLSVRHNDHLRDLTLAQVYQRIKSTTNKGGLAALVNQIDDGEVYKSGEYNFKVDFKACSYWTANPIYRNVQFRQHRATIDPSVAIYWTEIVVRFAKFAIASSDEVIMGDGETLEDLQRLITLPSVPDS